MPRNLQTTAAVESNEVQILDAPMMGGQKKRYALRPMDRVDSVIGGELLNNPPGEDEHVYASPKVMKFHDAKGVAKDFDRVQAVSADGRPAVIGGWLRTSDPDDIKALDEYCRNYSGDFRKVYPIVSAE